MTSKNVRSLVIVAEQEGNVPKWPVGILCCTDIIRAMANLEVGSLRQLRQ
jgi:hypothetical protein